MNEQKNVQAVQNAYAAFGRRDIQGILDACTDTIDWEFLGKNDLPMSGNRRGKPEVARFFKQVDEAWTFERFEPREFIAQGENVVALGWYSGKSKSTGKAFGCDWAHIFTFSSGKVAKFREYTDTLNMATAYSAATAKV